MVEMPYSTFVEYVRKVASLMEGQSGTGRFVPQSDLFVCKFRVQRVAVELC